MNGDMLTLFGMGAGIVIITIVLSVVLDAVVKWIKERVY